MVVFRPPTSGPVPVRPLVAPPQPPAQPPVQDVDTVLEREQAARAEADPRRHLNAVREAHLRRERESAQEREAAVRNEQLMRQLLDRNENMQNVHIDRNDPFSLFRHLQRQEERDLEMHLRFRRTLDQDRDRESMRRVADGLPPILDHDDVDVEEDDDESVASDNSSFVDEPVERPPPPRMTLGEAVTIYRMIEVFSPRHFR